MMKNNQRKKSQLIHSINITPFVDVMLVLLVIFMISAPEIMPSFPIDLPTADKSEITQEDTSIILTVDNNGIIYINDKSSKLENISEEIISLTKNNKETRIFIRGDEKCDYGLVIQLIDYINKYGFKKVSLVTKNTTA